MNKFKINKIVSIVIIASFILQSCRMFQSQKMIDNIIPDYTKRMYTVADLLPYTYKEIRNAQALYGRELVNYFEKNTSTPAEASRATKEEKDEFYYELLYRTHNYKTIKKRYAMFVGDGDEETEDKKRKCQEEYDEYYKIPTAKGAGVIKKYNDGKLSGMPLMSIRVDMSTATMSSLDSIYSEALCEIYKPTYIKEDDYKKLEFGDTIDLLVPATNSTALAKETKKVTCTYVATDSLLYKNEKGEDMYYFISALDGINGVRRVLDYRGETLETYVETATLQFMKYARVARSNDLLRLLSAVASDPPSLTEYNYNELAVRALGGGYVAYEYKDSVYANLVTTNLKGYITSLSYFDNQSIDNEFYNSIY